MEEWHIQLIETVVALVIYGVLRFSSRSLIRKVGQRFNYHIPRISVVKRMADFILIFILCAFVLLVWGVDQTQLVIFFSSLLTFMGVAFFAQWSIISNITASIIIFFNHPIRVGDNITILDKEYHIEGKIRDIGLYFIILETPEGERVTIPSNLIMQKMVKRKEWDEEKQTK
jgi:small-conductance mechanosensitive channel